MTANISGITLVWKSGHFDRPGISCIWVLALIFFYSSIRSCDPYANETNKKNCYWNITPFKLNSLQVFFIFSLFASGPLGCKTIKILGNVTEQIMNKFPSKSGNLQQMESFLCSLTLPNQMTCNIIDNESIFHCSKLYAFLFSLCDVLTNNLTKLRSRTYVPIFQQTTDWK